MPQASRVATLLLLAALPLLLSSGLEAGEIGAELQRPALKQHLRVTYTPAVTLSYRDARKHMFETIDDLDGDNQLVGVYTGTVFHAASIPDHTQVNCEHTWPQSMFDRARMKPDIHHLYPTFSVINSTRGNKPFGEIPDNAAGDWCGPGNNRSHRQPTGNIDDFSESNATHFEPREAHKGNVARSMFYFATIYEQTNGHSGWQQWFNAQLPTLLQWHTQDAVDAAEIARTHAIAGVQGNVNPFVIDPTLARRVFGDTNGAPSPAPAGGAPVPADSWPSGTVRILAVLANPPGHDEGREQTILCNDGATSVSLDGWKCSDAAGNELVLDGKSIAGSGTLTVTLEAGSMPLNNSGDTIDLLGPGGTLLHRFTYTSLDAQSGTFITQ